MPMNIRTHPRGAPPDFTLYRPRPNNMITDAAWWFMEQLLLLEPGTENGGQYAHKEGYHDSVEHNNQRSGAWQDYSTRADVDRQGNLKVSRGHDWTHPQAHSGNYTTMARYGDRLEAMFNARDPRLEGWREALGQTDKDATPEGLDFDDWYRRTPSSSHAWHWHFSEHTKWIEDFWNKWAMLTGLAGWTVAEWRQSLEEDVNDEQNRLLVEAERTAQNSDEYAYALARLATTVSGVRGNNNQPVTVENQFVLRFLALDERVVAVEQAVNRIETLLTTAGGSPDVAAILSGVSALISGMQVTVDVEAPPPPDAARAVDAPAAGI